MTQNPTFRSSSKHDRVRPPIWRSCLVIISATVALCVYLFVHAPLPLSAQTVDAGTVPIHAVFSMLELENDAARALWTEEIVNRGSSVGLAFDEAWRDDHVEAGPLPALFLRETAKHLERSSLGLRLFLGSAFPINTANHFTGQQAGRFTALADRGDPQFFFEPSTRLHTAMFADRAVVEACVRCHNEHADSPKTDWKLDAIMGATTWMYPDDAVTVERAVEMIATLRSSIRAAYAGYLAEVQTFAHRPTIGEQWPRDGFYLPGEAAFMRELARRTSTVTMRALIEPGWAETAAATGIAEEVVPAAPAAPAKPAAVERASGHATLVIRSARATRVTIEHAGDRLMIARLPAGGSTSLSSRPPLRIKLSNPAGVELEYAGKPVELPAADAAGTGEVEITVGALSSEKS